MREDAQYSKFNAEANDDFIPYLTKFKSTNVKNSKTWANYLRYPTGHLVHR